MFWGVNEEKNGQKKKNERKGVLDCKSKISITVPQFREKGMFRFTCLRLRGGGTFLSFDLEVSFFACRPNLCRYLPVLQIIGGGCFLPPILPPFGG